MEPKRKSLDMTQGDPIKLLVLFAIPMLIGGIFQLMYNMVDTIVVGRYVSIDALAAIGATSSTTMFLMFMGQSGTNAASVIISQAEGAKREDVLKKAIAHAYYLMFALGLILGLAAFFGARPLMRLLQTDGTIIDQSVTYIQITGGLTIALIFYNGASAILRAIGDSKTPLYFLIFSSVLNVGLDLLFVLALDGKVAGVAWATVISQLISAVLCTLYMLKKHPRLMPDREAWTFDKAMIREYLRIGLPMCVQQAVLCVGMFVITAVINSAGPGIMAAYTIGNKVENLATVTFSNFAFSFAVYAGQNFGAKRFDRIREGVKKGVLVITGLALISTAAMLLFAEPIAKIFMDSTKENTAEVLTASVSFVQIQAFLFVLLGIIWAFNSTLRGIGAVKITLASSILELVSKIGFSLLLPLFLGYVGIWWATPLGWILGLIPSTAYLFYWFGLPDDKKESVLKRKEREKAPAEEAPEEPGK